MEESVAIDNEQLQEQIKQWKTQHGEVIQVLISEDEYYLRKPKRPEYKRFTDTLSKSIYDAASQLVFSCLLSPSAEILATRIETNPDLCVLISGELQEQFSSKASSKKV
jgi:hypothetical protein